MQARGERQVAMAFKRRSHEGDVGEPRTQLREQIVQASQKPPEPGLSTRLWPGTDEASNLNWWNRINKKLLRCQDFLHILTVTTTYPKAQRSHTRQVGPRTGDMSYHFREHGTDIIDQGWTARELALDGVKGRPGNGSCGAGTESVRPPVPSSPGSRHV